MRLTLALREQSILEREFHQVSSQKSEARSQKSEVRSQKPEARSQKSEVRSQKLLPRGLLTFAFLLLPFYFFICSIRLQGGLPTSLERNSGCRYQSSYL